MLVMEIGEENLTEEDYANYMAAVANTGDLEEATRILDAMHAARLPRTQYTAYAMMTIAASSQNLELARAQFDSLRKSGYLTQNTTPWNEMISLLILRDDVRSARALFDEMRASAQPYPDTNTFNLILRKVDVGEILGLFAEMKEKRVYPNTRTYHIVALRLGLGGQLPAALQIVKEMRDAGFVITKILVQLHNNTKVT
jgi:hypothetical protein